MSKERLSTLSPDALGKAVGGNGNQTNGAINSEPNPDGGVTVDWNDRNKHMQGTNPLEALEPSTPDASGNHNGGWGIG